MLVLRASASFAGSTAPILNKADGAPGREYCEKSNTSPARVLFTPHIDGRASNCSELLADMDLKGVLAKRKKFTYEIRGVGSN